MGLAYFDLKPRPGADTSNVRPGALGAISHPTREHRTIEHESHFDPEKYGITDDDVRELFSWLSTPEHQVAVVVGPTGSGKSTVLPFRLINPPDGVPADLFTRHGQIVITQPRIQAARNIPAYVAKELYGSNLGAGYDIGFRHSNAPYSDWRNRLVYVTDGTLINWIVSGQIANLSVIMIDEAHERSLNIDLILGLLKKLLPRYPHMNLIVCSATIDSDLFVDYFGPDSARLVELQGRRKFDVETFFQAEDRCLPYEDMSRLRNLLPDETASTVVRLLEKMAIGEKEPGDILAFLRGVRPIEAAVTRIREAVQRHDRLADSVDIYPLYTKLPQEEQNKALLKKPDPTRRRVVVTTNVAETSLTVEDIAYVVDSGLINQAQWDPETQTKEVVPVMHSKAGCKQRWGRAGRIRDGEAHCLYTEEQFNALFPDYTIPQIQRSPLEQIVLTAKAAGVDDISRFDWIQRPPEEELERAPRVLQEKGALDQDGHLTEYGLELQWFAEEPLLANLMIVADRFACAVEMATVLPMLKAGGVRHLLHWDGKWDATTKRAVGRIHDGLKRGCRDDIEFCLKLYSAWSDAQSSDHIMVPEWAFLRVWPDYVPPLPAEMKEALGSAVPVFREAASAAIGRASLSSVVHQFGLEKLSEAWLAQADAAILRARRKAWARAFHVNHSLLQNKIEPEREELLDSLSGHKKQDERRPVDFALLDRLRIIFAYCLPDRRYETLSSVPIADGARRVVDGEHEASAGSNNGKTSRKRDGVQRVYRLRRATTGEEDARSTQAMPVLVNQDSVCYERDVSAFVCGKQRVLTRRLSPESAPEPILHASYISLIKPSWLEWLEQPRHSNLALARFIAGQTREPETGELRSADAQVRLFLDQAFPLGSRYEYDVIDVISEEVSEVELVRRVSGPREIQEDYRFGVPEEDDQGEEGEEDEKESTDEEDTVDGASIGELVDTVLTEEPVADPEEDIIPPWVDLVADSWEAALDSLPSDCPEGTVGTSLPESIVFSAVDECYSTDSQDIVPQYWSNEVSFHLNTKHQRVETGEPRLAEVVGFSFDDSGSPTVALETVPEREPFDVFSKHFRSGDTVELTAVDYDERPSDWLVSLVAREPVSGLEVLLEPERLGFTTRGFAVKQIPLGTEVRATLESIDKNRKKVHLSS
ncbi:MAG: helicase-related protein, partial [bacterium]